MKDYYAAEKRAVGKIRKRLKGFLEQNGIRLVLHRYSVGIPQGDERAPAYCPPDKTLNASTASNMIHEIAHYAVATNEEIAMPNFGLGTGPDDIYRPGKEDVSHRRTCGSHTEKEASLLGIIIEKNLGMDWKGTVSAHNWDIHKDSSQIKEVCTALYEMGLVTSPHFHEAEASMVEPLRSTK